METANMLPNKRPDYFHPFTVAEGDPNNHYLAEMLMAERLAPNASIHDLRNALPRLGYRDDGFFIAAMRAACPISEKQLGSVIVMVAGNDGRIVGYVPDQGHDLASNEFLLSCSQLVANFCDNLDRESELARNGFPIHFEYMPSAHYADRVADREAVERYGDYQSSLPIPPGFIAWAKENRPWHLTVAGDGSVRAVHTA